MGKLRRHRVTFLAALAVGLVCVGLAVTVSAVPDYMDILPSTSRFGCANCHVREDPNSLDHELNAFGVDFQAHGYVWDAELAQLNSDNDGCTNGVELGDSDGDGNLDGNITEETGNPGVPDDCGGGAHIDPVTWGALKALFQR